MKKRILSYVITLIMVIGLFPISAMAYTPQSSGLWIEGVMYATDANVPGYHEPANTSYYKDLTLLNNQNNKTVTVNIPKDATYVMFRYWDYGTPNKIAYPNNGWIFGDATHKINGINVWNQHADFSYASDGRIKSGNKLVADRTHIAFRADKFAKINNTDTFTVDAYRVVKTTAYSYKITYIINWVEPESKINSAK